MFRCAHDVIAPVVLDLAYFVFRIQSARNHRAQVPASLHHRLSDQGHQQAVAYGKKLLAARRRSSDVATSSDVAPTKDGIKYVGDQQVTVFFMENNSIFPVNVVAS
jgi:hypothetical protein